MVSELRMVIPPTTVGLYRDIYITITVYALSECSDSIGELSVEYDGQRNLEYVRIETWNPGNLAKCIADNLGLRVSSASDFEQRFYTKWRFSFDTSSNNYVLSMGGDAFPSPWARFYRAIADNIKNYTRFFYSRDVKSLSDRLEQATKGGPRPQRGFLDFTFDDANIVLFYFTKLRSCKAVYPPDLQIYITTSGVPVGKSALMIYVNNLLNLFLKFNKSEKRVEVVPQAAQFLSTRLAQEEPDIVFKWGELYILEHLAKAPIGCHELGPLTPVIRLYGVGLRDIREHNYCVDLDPMGICTSVRLAVEEAAKKLSVDVLDLASGLRRYIESLGRISINPDPRISGIADSLKSTLRIVVNSVTEGYVDIEALYKLERDTALFYEQHRVDDVKRLVEVITKIFGR